MNTYEFYERLNEVGTKIIIIILLVILWLLFLIWFLFYVEQNFPELQRSLNNIEYMETKVKKIDMFGNEIN